MWVYGLRSSQDLLLCGYPRKLTPCYIGPFKVLHRINTYHLALPPSLRVHPTFHVSRLRPVSCSVGSSDLVGLRMVDSAPAYTVKHLFDVQWVHGGVQYLLDWEGYGPEDPGSPPVTSWTVNSFGLFGEIVRLALGRQELHLPWGSCKGQCQAEAPSDHPREVSSQAHH
ncbi:hypothetical protein P4O66_014276 [Electrophorus voltai]|uniref:Tf2-1-like SH3-like domain-containing protein n=1 Tax=Electrophorus voltai TaxID=2609070 RepID=A0AAD9DQJ2_9TELE|nr:hypothetical protein P4O66_014276 [Electrophorus voltai]